MATAADPSVDPVARAAAKQVTDAAADSTFGATVRVCVVYALPRAQRVVELALADGATVAEAVAQSGLLEEFPELNREAVAVGIFNRACALQTRLRDGDRVEIYRPLVIDPKEARRARALQADQQKAGRAHGR
jgi:putative ubiquitin-RnfH superfamily antitoxin RatB of RatAB toxin-antitoxin module